jgi:hypothetical protein
MFWINWGHRAGAQTLSQHRLVITNSLEFRVGLGGIEPPT